MTVSSSLAHSRSFSLQSFENPFWIQSVLVLRQVMTALQKPNHVCFIYVKKFKKITKTMKPWTWIALSCKFWLPCWGWQGDWSAIISIDITDYLTKNRLGNWLFFHAHLIEPIIHNDRKFRTRWALMVSLVRALLSNERGESAVSCNWTGWVWGIIGWSSRLLENYQSL